MQWLIALVGPAVARALVIALLVALVGLLVAAGLIEPELGAALRAVLSGS